MRTVVRVGQLLPAASMRLTMSLHDGSGEITANRVKTGKPMYNDSSNSMTQKMMQLDDVKVLPQYESDEGVARGACVAEATFEFKFSVTAAQVHGISTKTLVWLRFTVDGSPNLYVETLPFRLVAKKDGIRSNLHELGSKRLRSSDSGGLLEYQDLSAGGDDGPPQFTSCSAGANEGPPPCFRSLGGDDDEVPLATGRGEDEGDAESEYEHEEENEEEAHEREVANALARTRSQTIIDQAHAVDELQILLSALRTGGELPTGATLCLLLQRNSRC